MPDISIFIVQNQQLVRQALTLQLSKVPGFTVAGCCESSCEAVEIVKQLRPDVVLFDIGQENVDGVDITRLMRKYSPGSEIVCISMHTQTFLARRLFKMGALGFLTKNSSSCELIEATRQV